MNDQFKDYLTLKYFKNKSYNSLLLFIISIYYSCNTNFNLNQNNLTQESSAYLKQHANNPINWQRWEESLYKKYNTDEKLLVVSIGYSSCHWCHVMEKETFEATEVAEYMNANFISIKVDREENPEVDTIYMTATQMMTGSGGWPLNVVCLPDGRPVYGGTYHTKEQWLEVLGKIQKLYENDKKQLYTFADRVENGIQEVNRFEYTEEAKVIDPSILQSEMALWSSRWDTINGGEQQNQKFITPVKFNYIQHYQNINSDLKVKTYFEQTLTKIASSGIVDHLEGGFYRYTVDPEWKIPHFEKMLYDNAQLLGLFSNAYKETQQPLFRETVYNTFSFLKNRMKSSQGAFYAAIDADNNQGEGRYYIFNKEELEQVGSENLELLLDYYQLNLNKPFEDEWYHLRQIDDPSALEVKYKLSAGELESVKRNWEKEFNTLKSKREFPLIDTKIITSWNALVVSGMVTASEAFNDKEFLKQAEETFDFLFQNLLVKGELMHTYQMDQAKLEGNLEDYAFLIKAALDLYRITGNTFYLDRANQFKKKVYTKFETSENPFFTFTENPVLFSELISVDDNVIPSANAVMAENLWSLGQLLENKKDLEKANQMMQAVLPYFSEGRASDYSQWAQLLAKEAFNLKEVIIVGAQARALNQAIQQNYLPNTLFQISESASELPLLSDRFMEEETLIYVCENKVCLRPVNHVEKALQQLKN